MLLTFWYNKLISKTVKPREIGDDKTPGQWSAAVALTVEQRSRPMSSAPEELAWRAHGLRVTADTRMSSRQ